MIKVSVIIPVYNAEKYLEECLDSLLRQTFTDMEIICVDDGSTDSSAEILKRFQEKDRRIRVLFQENQYAGIARNNGMKIAQGEYLLFLDADDFFEDTLLEKIYSQGKKMGADIVLFGAKQYNRKMGCVSPASWYLKTAAVPEENPFSDCNEPAALKAYGLGIIAGVEPGTFAPENPLTREQMAIMLVRTLEKVGVDMSLYAKKNPFKYKNANSIKQYLLKRYDS